MQLQTLLSHFLPYTSLTRKKGLCHGLHTLSTPRKGPLLHGNTGTSRGLTMFGAWGPSKQKEHFCFGIAFRAEQTLPAANYYGLARAQGLVKPDMQGGAAQGMTST